VPQPDRRERLSVGVDGCRAGWLVASLEDDELKLTIADDEALASWIDAAQRTHIDMPIGLPSDTASRDCDSFVRRALGPGATSRVFNPPVRSVLDASDYVDACTRNHIATGRRISKQTWFLVPRIRALDSIVRVGQRRHHTREAHPEWQFAVLAGHTLARKKSADGAQARRAVLDQYMPGRLDVADRFLASTRRADVQPDDVYDAMILAWGAAQPDAALIRAPEDDVHDAMGLPCAIWAAQPCRINTPG
jgi:predicted RNase H-like nuclease